MSSARPSGSAAAGDLRDAAPPPESFGRAYAAIWCLLGERGESLNAATSSVAPAWLVRALAHADRETRVAVLARETTAIGLALEALSLARTGARWR